MHACTRTHIIDTGVASNAFLAINPDVPTHMPQTPLQMDSQAASMMRMTHKPAHKPECSCTHTRMQSVIPFTLNYYWLYDKFSSPLLPPSHLLHNPSLILPGVFLPHPHHIFIIITPFFMPLFISTISLFFHPSHCHPPIRRVLLKIFT